MSIWNSLKRSERIPLSCLVGTRPIAFSHGKRDTPEEALVGIYTPSWNETRVRCLVVQYKLISYL